MTKPTAMFNRTPGQTAPWLVVLTDFVFALMFVFAALIGEIDPQVFARDVPLPGVRAGDGQRPGLLVEPRFENDQWVFVGAQGAPIRAADLVSRARREDRGIVLVMSKDAPVESYIAAREALVGGRDAPPVALGVRRREP